jgi:hypothetical protein
MRNGQPMLPKTAMIACALFCDSTFELIDGDPRKFCVLAWRDGEQGQYTSNLAPESRAEAAARLREQADRLDPQGNSG